MRLANVNARAVMLASGECGTDIAVASGGRFGPDLQHVFDHWDDFRSWSAKAQTQALDVPVRRESLGSPSPAPSQILAIGLNYADHAKEAGLALPSGVPAVFTKFRSSLTGPDTTVELPLDGKTDWEVELVVIIGRTSRHVAEEAAWDHVAGLTVGQDLSERTTQTAGQAPQFSLGKSFAGFCPVGPWLVTPDEFADRDDLVLGCSIDGEVVQAGRTSDLILSVPAMISALTQIVTLNPGDLIFTGTPAGVGMGQDPQRFLRPGQLLTSWVEGIGQLHQTFVAPANHQLRRTP